MDRVQDEGLGGVVHLTADHRPDRPDEALRVMKAGGVLKALSPLLWPAGGMRCQGDEEGVLRVWPSCYNFTRTLGSLVCGSSDCGRSLRGLLAKVPSPWHHHCRPRGTLGLGPRR